MRAYFEQTHEMLFDADNHAFRVLGGVPRRGIYDNMKTAVDKVGRGKDRQVNFRFLAMTSHHLFDTEFCNPASGLEKGQIEKNVQDSRHRLWQPMPNFPSLDPLTIGWRHPCFDIRTCSRDIGGAVGSTNRIVKQLRSRRTPPGVGAGLQCLSTTCPHWIPMRLSIIIALAAACVGASETANASDACMAAVYSGGFGRPLADGKRHSADELLIAHRKMPFGTVVEITLVKTGAKVRAVVRDRGPFVRNMCVDLSRGAAHALGLTGIGLVTIEAVDALSFGQASTK